MSSKTILVVDDDPDILFFCTSLLGSHGYVVKTANSGASGLEAAKAIKPDLIILDIMMEKINTGYAIAEELGREFPILMFSSMLNPSDATFDPEKVPYRDVVSKPIAGAILLEKIRGIIGE